MPGLQAFGTHARAADTGEFGFGESQFQFAQQTGAEQVA